MNVRERVETVASVNMPRRSVSSRTRCSNSAADPKGFWRPRLGRVADQLRSEGPLWRMCAGPLRCFWLDAKLACSIPGGLLWFLQVNVC